MSTRPLYESLDLQDTTQIADLAIARASILPRTSHVLMSAWGGPPQSRSVFFASTGTADVRTISYRVPPGVTDVDISALIYGNGTVLFTTSADSTGTQFRSVGLTDEILEGASWHRTNGVLSSDNGAESGRALGVLSAEVWEYTNVDITVTVDADTSSDDLYLLSLIFRPIHVPR